MPKDVYIQIRIDNELKAAAQAIAEAEGRNLSELLRDFLEEYVGNHEKDG